MTDSTSDAPATEAGWLNPSQQRAWRAYMVGTTLLTDRLDDELRARFGIGLRVRQKHELQNIADVQP